MVFLRNHLVLLDPPALPAGWLAARILFDMRTVQVPSVSLGPWVSAGSPLVPHTGTPGLLTRVEQLAGQPSPVPGDATTLEGAPVPATLLLAPLNIARRKHLLLHIILVFVLVSLFNPFLEILLMLSWLSLCIIKCTS